MDGPSTNGHSGGNRSLVIGADEAGYGPNLGPLVVSLTAWEVQGPPESVDFYEPLRGVVERPGVRGPTNGERPLVIGDSKAVYQPSSGLGQLERGVLAALGQLGPVPRTAAGLAERLDPAAAEVMQRLPWHEGADGPVPCEVEWGLIEQDAGRLARGLKEAGLRLAAMASRALFPEAFNARVEELGNKSAALTDVTLSLVFQTLVRLEPASCLVICDHHGSRQKYAACLSGFLDGGLVSVAEESAERSIYRFAIEGRPVEVRFVVRAEEHLPVALASMTSKYFREVAMRAFNAWWCERVPGLRPTAGYPVDARRFKDQIKSEQDRLGIADGVLWRRK